MNIPSPTQRLRIGEVASSSGLSVKTIRYYEEIGLLTPNVLRAESGYRLFEPGVLDRLAFIKRAQSFGLSLTDVKDILQVHDRGVLPCSEIKQYLQEKMQEISNQIEALTRQRSQLELVLASWNENPAWEATQQSICPNLQK